MRSEARRTRAPYIRKLVEVLDGGIDGHHFDFFVVSAAPEEVVQSALEGILPPERIRGTRFRYDPATGEIRSIERVPAGYGKALFERHGLQIQEWGKVRTDFFTIRASGDATA